MLDYLYPVIAYCNLSNQIFHCTRSTMPKRVTSLRGPSLRQCALGTQLLSKKCCCLASRWQPVSDLTGTRFEPQTIIASGLETKRELRVTLYNTRPTNDNASFRFFDYLDSEEREDANHVKMHSATKSITTRVKKNYNECLCDACN